MLIRALTGQNMNAKISCSAPSTLEDLWGPWVGSAEFLGLQRGS